MDDFMHTHAIKLTAEPVTQPGWYTLADDTTRRVTWSRGVGRSATGEEVELWGRGDEWKLARGGY